MESTVKYGQELGVNLIKVAKRLIKNQNLCRLLVNTDLDPLNSTFDIDGLSLLHKNIRVIPFLAHTEESTQSKIVLTYSQGIVTNNYDNEKLILNIGVYTPFKEWTIVGDNLRPLAIMAEIRKSLQDKRINGLGEIKYNEFNLIHSSEEMGCYLMEFVINVFS